MNTAPDQFSFRRATPADAVLVDAALARLGADLGDPHAISPAHLAALADGPGPSLEAVLALDGRDVAGLALATPVFSTTRNGFGIFVSDLWVATEVRGAGLGPALLSATIEILGPLWGASFLKLSVYRDNVLARRFYDRIGFVEAPNEDSLYLGAAAFDAMREKS